MSDMDTPSYSSGLVCRFDDVRIDCRSQLIWKEGRTLHLEPKAFQLLCYLIDHRERLIEKQELLDAVWGDTFVSENAMTRVIAQLRRLLGDEAKEAKYIETVVKRGYRFIAEVEIEVEPAGVSKDRIRHRGAQRSILWMIALGFVAGLVVIAGLMTSRREGERGVPEMSLLRSAQVTSSPGLEFYPALSSDGSLLAYSSDRSGDFEIYVKQLTPGGGEIQLTSDGQQNFQPAFSPDDQYVAYYSMGRGGIWVVPAMGGMARQITDFGAGPAWSPDGRRIAFQSTSPSAVGINAYQAGLSSTIWICPSSGGEPRPITKAGHPRGGHAAPDWSPDGSRILFTSSGIGVSAMWSVDPDGNHLTEVPGLGRKYEAVFSPVSDHVYYIGRFRGLRYGVFKVPVGEGVLDSSQAVLVADATPAVVRYVTVSRNGKKLAWSTLSMSGSLGSIRVSPETYEPEGEPVLLTDSTSCRDTHPNISPNGRKVVFIRWTAGPGWDLWLVDADGENAKQLTTRPGFEWRPSWSLDGTRVYFGAPREDRQGIWSIDIDNLRELLVLCPKIDFSAFRFSPDGRFLVLARTKEGIDNIWTMPIEGEEARQITFDKEWANYPCWSPDGKFIAYEIQRGEDIHIAVIPSEGGTPTQLTFDPGKNFVESFSPDGDKVAFAGNRNGIWNVWWVSRTDKTQRQITNYNKRNAHVRYPSWSPRGDQIVYEYAETTGDIWLAEIKE